jgi:hypothetical protein
MKTLKNIFPLAALAVVIAILALGMQPTPTQAQAVVPTPTAQPDGRIIYIAQAGDTWWTISIKTGVTQEQLYSLNNTRSDDVVMEGQQILLGIITPTPVVPTSSAATPTPAVVTPQVSGTGNICVLLYDDANGDSSRQMEELQLPGGAISLVNSIGTINLTGTTTSAADPACFNDLPAGDYNLSVAVPEGYNPTTNTSAPITLLPGDQSTLNFGAQAGSLLNPGGVGGTGRNPLLGIAGLVLVLAGGGMAFFIWRSRRL